MTYTKSIGFLGLLVAAVPFLGFPTVWKNTAAVVLGALLLFLAFRAAAQRVRISGTNEKKDHKPYEQNDAALLKRDEKHFDEKNIDVENDEA